MICETSLRFSIRINLRTVREWELVVVLLMSIHRHAMLAHAVEQMGSIRRSDALRCKMASNVEIGRIFSLLHNLMMLFGFDNCVLLRTNVLRETFVAPFIVAPDFANISFNRRKFFLGGGKFFLRDPG